MELIKLRKRKSDTNDCKIEHKVQFSPKCIFLLWLYFVARTGDKCFHLFSYYKRHFVCLFVFSFFSFFERTIPSTGYGCMLTVLEKGLQFFIVKKRKPKTKPTNQPATSSQSLQKVLDIVHWLTSNKSHCIKLATPGAQNYTSPLDAVVV